MAQRTTIINKFGKMAGWNSVTARALGRDIVGIKTIEERLALQASLPSGTRIQDIAPFPIVVAYDYGGTVYKDIIQNCRITDNGVDVKQGDKTIATDHNLLTSHINWNV